MEIQRGGNRFSLGPLTSTVLDRAKWAGRDEWPAWPCFAAEAERLFSFALAHDVFGLYLNELCGKPSQRDSAIEELRVAYFLDRNGFQIVQWRPVGNASHEGEFIARCPSGGDIIVEVKSPGWESELSEAEKREGRRKQEKYIDGEGRAIDNAEAIVRSVEKAYPKFTALASNLLIVVDDLFISMEYLTDTWARDALYYRNGLRGRIPPGKFVTPAFDRLGGVGLLWHKVTGTTVWYEMKLYLNPFARVPCALPPAFAWAFNGTVL